VRVRVAMTIRLALLLVSVLAWRLHAAG